jgi:nucleotide-binding universal stress UspA family protein
VTGESAPAPIRRILVALDSMLASEKSLTETARLAARWEAELCGLFVEDINLLHLAGLPFARETGFSIALTRQIGAEEMERALRARATQARCLLEKTATRESVRWSFRVVRGKVEEELSAAAEEADLVALALPGRLAAPGTMRTRAPRHTGRAPRPVLFLPHGGTMRLPVIAVVGQTAASTRVLALAANVLAGTPRTMSLLLSPSTDTSARELMDRAHDLLHDSEILVEEVRTLPGASVESLLAAVSSLRAGTLILPADLDWLAPADIDALLNVAPCAVLLVR